MKRLLFMGGFFILASSALALATFSKVFDTTYGVKGTSNLGKANCGVCHVGKMGGKLNPYGTDMAEAMKAAGTKKLTAEILKKLDALDSDKDGMKNADEIKADRFPGKAD